MTKKEMTVSELEKCGFDFPDSVSGSIIYNNIDEILSYFENDQDAIEEIKRLLVTSDVILELFVHITGGIASSFHYGFGRSPETVSACNEDDLQGVIEWLRR